MVGSFDYLEERLAKMDTEKTMFQVYIDEQGEKRVHYLGYFYENDDGLKLVEYTGFDVPFADIHSLGLLDYETENGDFLGGQQYITDFLQEATEDSFNVIKNYFRDETVVFLHKDHQFEDLPCGCYAASIFTLKELQNLYEKQLEAQLPEPIPEKAREAADQYGLYAAHPDVLKHQEELLFCYENRIGLIDFDCWTHYEDLLGEKITYDEYCAIDSQFDYDVLDVEPGDKEVKKFKRELKEFRESISVDVVIGNAKDVADEHNGNIKSNKEKSTELDM